MMIVIERIQTAIKNGQLPEFKENKQLKTVKKVKDYLIPYEKFFYQGAEFLQEEIHIDQPKFIPVPRTQQKRLAVPKPLKAPNKMVYKAMFSSVKAIHDYYKLIDFKVPKALMNAKADHDGLHRFAEELVDILEYPLASNIECCWEEEYAIPCFSLLLPAMSYEMEESGILEAFLTGEEAIASMLMHLDGDRGLNFTANERRLIKKVGYVELFKFYKEFDEEDKLVDIKYFENWYENYFERLEKEYPDRDVGGMPVITGNGHEEIDITCVEDIVFASAWTDRYYDMLRALPCINTMEHHPEQGETEKLVRDTLRIWKKGH